VRRYAHAVFAFGAAQRPHAVLKPLNCGALNLIRRNRQRTVLPASDRSSGAARGTPRKVAGVNWMTGRGEPAASSPGPQFPFNEPGGVNAREQCRGTERAKSALLVITT
jgi:hypothetical protein